MAARVCAAGPSSIPRGRVSFLPAAVLFYPGPGRIKGVQSSHRKKERKREERAEGLGILCFFHCSF
jgi:hypothetical protein